MMFAICYPAYNSQVQAALYLTTLQFRNMGIANEMEFSGRLFFKKKPAKKLAL